MSWSITGNRSPRDREAKILVMWRHLEHFKRIYLVEILATGPILAATGHDFRFHLYAPTKKKKDESRVYPGLFSVFG